MCIRDPGVNYYKAAFIFNLVTHSHTNGVSSGENIIKIQRRGQKEGREVNGKIHKQGKLGAPGKELWAAWKKSILSKRNVICTTFFK